MLCAFFNVIIKNILCDFRRDLRSTFVVIHSNSFLIDCFIDSDYLCNCVLFFRLRANKTIVTNLRAKGQTVKFKIYLFDEVGSKIDLSKYIIDHELG